MIVVISNQKGGTGKTTSAVTIGAGLARRGYKTLIIDLDSQGNVADSLGLDTGGDLYSLLSPEYTNGIEDVATPSGRGDLDIIRSNKTTTVIKKILSGMEFSAWTLSDKLEAYTYDMVLLDCAPSVDVLHMAALMAADVLLVPTRLEQLSIKGIRDALETLDSVKKRGSSCEFEGVLPTFYDRVTNESHDQLVHLVKVFGAMVLPPIPVDVNCRVATRYGQTLWEFSPNTRALTGADGNGGYIQVVDRIEERWL